MTSSLRFSVFWNLYFFSRLTRAEKKQTVPSSNPPPQSPKAPDQKNDWTIRSRGAQMLAKCTSLSFRLTTERCSAHSQRHPGVSLNQFVAPAVLHTLSLFKQELAAAGLMHLAL